MIVIVGVAGECVLDVGCGVGGPALQLAQSMSVSVVGVEVNRELVTMAQQGLAAAVAQTASGVSVSFTCGVVAPEVFADDSFDAIVSRDAIHHVKVCFVAWLCRSGVWYICWTLTSTLPATGQAGVVCCPCQVAEAQRPVFVHGLCSVRSYIPLCASCPVLPSVADSWNAIRTQPTTAVPFCRPTQRLLHWQTSASIRR